MIKILSADDATGALSGVLVLPPGFRRGIGHLAVDSEYFVLAGTVRIGETVREFGFYNYAPAGVGHEPWTVEAGCELFFKTSGPPDFVLESGLASNGRIELDSERMPWTLPTFEGPPPGMVVKVLRHVEQSGAMTALTALIPRLDLSSIEFHECIEEFFYIEGDLWVGPKGLMTPGSYFWVPPFFTHGPFYSRSGSLLIAWIESAPVVNHQTGLGHTPKENRGQLERERASKS